MLWDPEVIKLTGSTSDFDRETVINWYNTRNDKKTIWILQLLTNP